MRAQLLPASRPSRWLVLATILLLAGCSEPPETAAVARPAMVAQPEADGSRVEVFPGVVRARWESPLSFRVAGKLVQRSVEVGERVAAGQALAELDAGDAELAVAAVRAQRLAAKADLELAAAERDRHRAMVQRRLISESLYQARETQYEAAAARLEQLDAQLAASRNQAGYTALTAPHAGVVTALHAEVGQVLAAGQPMLTLAREDALEVAISLPEQRRADFAPGDDAAIELWAREGERIAGQLREIAPSADPMARTHAARVAFDAGGDASWLGQTARVYFVRQGGSGLTVPLSALHAEDGSPALWVVDPATRTVHLRGVTVGPYSETRVPVLSGLAADEWVVTAGVHLLREGQAIVPIDRDNRRLDLAAR